MQYYMQRYKISPINNLCFDIDGCHLKNLIRLERWLSILLLQKTHVAFLTPRLGDPQQPVTPVPGELLLL